MDRLVTDIVVRRTAQVVVLAVLIGLIGLCLSLDIFVHLRTVGRLDNLDAPIRIFGFLASPLKETFSALIAIITATVPVVLSAVCFTVERSGATPTAGSELNRVGHAAFLLTVLGLLVGAFTLVLFTLDKAAVVDLANGAGQQAAIQGLINGIVAFNGVYFAQLLGLKPK